jgi:GntR family transcriptional regulator, transcriptional repressor for pyruvate dehydrogenase complex
VTDSLSAFAVRRTESVDSQITRKLLEFLLSGAVLPERRLPSERELSEQLGVGRQSIRNALKALALLGIVEARVGSGTYFVGGQFTLIPQVIEWPVMLGETWTNDFIDARTQLEIVFAGLAAERRTETQLDELYSILCEMRDAGDDYGPYARADARFHLAIANASGNKLLAGVLRDIGGVLRSWAEQVVSTAGETASSLPKHEAIFEAIRDQDVGRAREAMISHMERARKRLLDSLPNTDGERH